jgi:hypothetical protein
VDALLNEIDISPPHLLDWKPLHAVAIAVTDRRMTAISSRQPADVSGITLEDFSSASFSFELVSFVTGHKVPVSARVRALGYALSLPGLALGSLWARSFGWLAVLWLAMTVVSPGSGESVFVRRSGFASTTGP